MRSSTVFHRKNRFPQNNRLRWAGWWLFGVLCCVHRLPFIAANEPERSVDSVHRYHDLVPPIRLGLQPLDYRTFTAHSPQNIQGPHHHSTPTIAACDPDALIHVATLRPPHSVNANRHRQAAHSAADMHAQTGWYVVPHRASYTLPPSPGPKNDHVVS